MNILKTQWLRILVHLGGLYPLTVLMIDWLGMPQHLGADPIRESILRTGRSTLVLLVLSLACTPVNTLLGLREALKARRTLGLYAFAYAALHLTIFVGVDYQFDFSLLYEAIFEKPYALAGLTAFLILVPLAITSTKGWMKRLGKTWRRIHFGIYFAVPIGVIHFVWSVKLDIREPLIYGAIVAALLFLRLTPIRRAISHLRHRSEEIMSTRPSKRLTEIR